ncbi:MAG: tetratricopeptide repeat protein [Thermodesulfobacteriota bacterium]
MGRPAGRCRPALLALLLALAGSAPPALAHIDPDDTPDPVAEMEYRILLEFQPEDTATRNKLAMVLFRLGRLGDAEAELRRVLAAQADDADALDGLGLVQAAQGRPADAVRSFAAARRARPGDLAVHLHLGQALEAQGDLPGAEAAYREGLAAGQPAADPQERTALAAALEALRQRTAGRPGAPSGGQP